MLLSPTTPQSYTLSLHDALPISGRSRPARPWGPARPRTPPSDLRSVTCSRGRRSEEHTSELQSHSDLVCRLLLEKKRLGVGCELVGMYSVVAGASKVFTPSGSTT